MWFSLPKGTRGITVEHQEFNSEVTDDKGIGYFRAPDHFSPRILAIPGFGVAEPPEGHGIEDLPKSDPLRDGAIGELTQTVAAQKLEIRDLREDLGSANAKIIALSNEKTDLTTKLQEVEAIAEGLREQLEDKGQVPNEVIPIRKAK